MKKVFLLVVALAFISWGQAFANTFTFTFDGATYDASGTLNAVSNGDGSYTATSGSGVANSDLMTLYANPSAPAFATSPQGAFWYDNQLFPAQNPLVDWYGLLFTVDSDTTREINIYFDNGYVYYQRNGINERGSFELTQVPEPMTMLLLGLGLVGVGILRRKSS